VVNEAMASGLPVLASNRCGCAADLIRDGVNGFVFDPLDGASLTKLFVKISQGENDLHEFGRNSRKIISNYSPALFAQRASSHLTGLYERRVQQENGKGQSLRRVIAENAYALFSASGVK